jgi:HEAT repeat protein
MIVDTLIEDGRLTDDEALMGGEPTVDFLLECLEDKSWEVRREAAIALERFEDKRIIDSLIKALKDKH